MCGSFTVPQNWNRPGEVAEAGHSASPAEVVVASNTGSSEEVSGAGNSDMPVELEKNDIGARIC